MTLEARLRLHSSTEHRRRVALSRFVRQIAVGDALVITWPYWGDSSSASGRPP